MVEVLWIAVKKYAKRLLTSFRSKCRAMNDYRGAIPMKFKNYERVQANVAKT